MDIEAELGAIFSERSSAPFLFLGSGFSRRYLGLEDWEGLLTKFCVNKKPFAYYRGRADGDIPRAAQFIAEDFHDTWWGSDDYIESRDKYSGAVQDSSSPLRFEICSYLQRLSHAAPIDASLVKEIQALSECDVDGIITTNWDCFIEQLFDTYKVYVGQKELLFSTAYNVGEIYKIHGCCKQPESIVLTSDDYKDYNERNAYLASKLITIFVEHPVVFIGYSLQDENIREMLRAISLCVGPEHIEHLRDNLIFIDRHEPEGGPTIEVSYQQFDSVPMPVKVVKTADFTPVYIAISQFERKLPARVLRFCKERVYELVKGQNPDSKLAVIDYEDAKNKDDIEVVFGLGIIAKLGSTGYRAILTEDIYEDFLFNNKSFDSANLLNITVAGLTDGTKYAPVFKHLKSLGISSNAQIRSFNPGIERFALQAPVAYPPKPLQKKYAATTFAQFLAAAPENEIFNNAPYFPDFDVHVMMDYLRGTYAEFSKGKYKYYARKLMAFCDWKLNGF